MRSFSGVGHCESHVNVITKDAAKDSEISFKKRAARNEGLQKFH